MSQGNEQQLEACRNKVAMLRAHADVMEVEARRLEFHLRLIADGETPDPRVQARVALGDLPIAALLHHAEGGLVGSARPLKGST